MGVEVFVKREHHSLFSLFSLVMWEWVNNQVLLKASGEFPPLRQIRKLQIQGFIKSRFSLELVEGQKEDRMGRVTKVFTVTSRLPTTS